MFIKTQPQNGVSPLPKPSLSEQAANMTQENMFITICSTYVYILWRLFGAGSTSKRDDFFSFGGREYPKTQFIAPLHLKIRMWSPGSPALGGKEVFSLEFPYGVQERAFSNKLFIARRDQPLLWQII